MIQLSVVLHCFASPDYEGFILEKAGAMPSQFRLRGRLPLQIIVPAAGGNAAGDLQHAPERTG
jgi:hypothetical protein